MDNSKVPSFGKSDKQLADAFGMSASDFKKVKKQIVSDMTKPKATAKATPKVGMKATPKGTPGKAADPAKAQGSKIKITGKATASGNGKNKPTLKLNQYGQPVKSKSSTKKSSPSLASQAGKVAGKVAGAAKSKVKADIKAAKMVAGVASNVVKSPVKSAKTVAKFVAKQAMPPSSNPILKGAKAVGKAIAGDSLKIITNTKKAKKK